MSSLLMILLLSLLQLFAGFGLLSFFRPTISAGTLLPLSLLGGIAVFSFIPFLLQLLYIPLTSFSVFLSLILATLLLNLRIHAVKSQWLLVRSAKMRIQFYELPFLLVIGLIVFLSVWRCFYFPPTPRDLTSGAELIAEYTVREKTMINSVFTVNMETNNNQFKSPFITSLQIIYKYAGFPFGQIWLSSVFIGFLAFLYRALCKNLHPIIAGFLLLSFVAIPEMYAYTFMVLYDYSTAVYFCIGTFFLVRYFENGHPREMALAGLFMGMAVYIRSESLVLVALFLPALFWHHIKRWEGLQLITRAGLLLLIPSVFFYLITIWLYNDHYLPNAYPVEGLVNHHLLNLGPLFARFADVNNKLIFSETGIDYYAYFIFIFLLVLLLDLVLTDKWSTASRNWLYAVLVVYLGLPVLGYLLPLMDLDNSTKRGLFRIFPLMLLYMGNCGLLSTLSENIREWERK
ncbi:MAG: hypothetical protein ACJ75B_06880 [Flavisolibacter sp.]